MNARTKRVTVRAYNLRPGDVVAANGRIVESAVHYPGTWVTAWTDVVYRDAYGTVGVTYDADVKVTVTRTY